MLNLEGVLVCRVFGLTEFYCISQMFASSLFQPAIDFLRRNVKEIVGTVDCNLVFSLLKLLECFFTPFMPKEVSYLLF